MRRLILALAILVSGPATVGAAQDFPYGPTHSFAAFRNGERIGTHTLTFSGTGDQRTVTTSIDFAVKVLGLTMYRYKHQGQEIWNGNAFQSLATQTDDNGAKFTVRAARQADGGVATTATGGQKTLPAGTVPSTHWNFGQVQQSAILNSQNGNLSKVQITPKGRETIRTANGSLPANRYTYAGDVEMDQWFDDRGRWVKSAFKASDGSTIEYILQE